MLNMKAMVYEINQQGIWTDIDSSLDALQELVGGYIELVGMGNGVVMLVDEEGLLKHKPRNFTLQDRGAAADIYGTVVFLRVKGEDFCSLKKQDVNFIQELVGR